MILNFSNLNTRVINLNGKSSDYFSLSIGVNIIFYELSFKAISIFKSHQSEAISLKVFNISLIYISVRVYFFTVNSSKILSEISFNYASIFCYKRPDEISANRISWKLCPIFCANFAFSNKFSVFKLSFEMMSLISDFLTISIFLPFFDLSFIFKLRTLYILFSMSSDKLLN